MIIARKNDKNQNRDDSRGNQHLDMKQQIIKLQIMYKGRILKKYALRNQQARR